MASISFSCWHRRHFMGPPIAGPLKGRNGEGRLDRSTLHGQPAFTRLATFPEEQSSGRCRQVRHTITTGYALLASPSKGRRIRQRAEGNTSVGQIPLGPPSLLNAPLQAGTAPAKRRPIDASPANV